MIETIYKLNFEEGVHTCDYKALADAITAQYFAMPVELRQTIKIAFTYARTTVCHLLQQRGVVPVKMVYFELGNLVSSV